MFYGVPRMPVIKYAHKPINEDRFIFPIEGLIVNGNLKIGSIDFVDKSYLIKNVIDEELSLNVCFEKEFKNVKTFAVIDLRKFSSYKKLCSDGLNSLALQLLKQTIGALYLSIYNKKTSVDCERKIVISNKGVLEVDEGLNSYLAIYNGEYMICPSNVHDLLVADCNDFDLENIKSVVKILEKNFKYRTEYEKKICKTLEIIYSIYNECYSRERIIKWVIVLNYIFREDDSQDLDSTNIGRKLRIIFNVIEKQEVFEKLPVYICQEPKKTRKISDIVIEVYKRVRNNLMHGKIDFYTEYAVCNTEDLIILKVTVLELLNIMAKEDYLARFEDIKAFNKFVEEKEAEHINECKLRKQNNK